MNIFITGASGFVGQNLLKRLLDDPRIQNIVCLYRQLPQEKHKKIIYVEGDLSSIGTVTLTLAVDAVIHLAGKQRSTNQKILDACNVDGTQNVCNFSKTNSIEKIIYTSTINIHLDGPYGKSKLSSEKILATSNLKYTIFRPALIYGPNNKSGAVDKIAHFISKLHIMPIFGNGSTLEQPIYIDDIVSYIHKAIFMSFENETYTIGGPVAYSYNELVGLIGKRIGKKFIPLHVPVSVALALVKCAEKCKISLPITSEQILHQLTDLTIDHEISSKKFEITMTDFWDGLAYLTDIV